MSEAQPTSNRKACLIVALLVSPILLCMMAVVALAAWFVVFETPVGQHVFGMPPEQYSEDVLQLRERVEAEMETARAQLEHDMANLPPDCPLAKGWRFETAVENAWEPVEENTIYNLALCARYTLLGAEEEDIQYYFLNVREHLAEAYKSGNATELEKRFRPAGRPRDVVLRDFRDYVMQAEYLNQLETAVDYGVARHIQDAPFDYSDESLDRVWLIVELFELRVLYALEDGDLEAALQTCYRMHQFARPEVFPHAPYWNREQFMDCADCSLAYVMGCAPVSEVWRQRLLEEYDRRPQHDEIEAHLLVQVVYDAEWYDYMPMFNKVKQANQVLEAFRGATELLDPPLVAHRDEIQRLLKSHRLDIMVYQEDTGLIDTIASLPSLPKQAMGEQLKETLGDVEFMSRFRFMKEVARTAFALEDYRAKHGRYPDDLNALIPEFLDQIPAEPALNDPLGYTLREDGYELWLPFWSWYFWEPPVEEEELDPEIVWEVQRDLFAPETP